MAILIKILFWKLPRQKIDHWEFELIGKSNKIDVTSEYESFIDKEVLATQNNKDIYQSKKPEVSRMNSII